MNNEELIFRTQDLREAVEKCADDDGSLNPMIVAQLSGFLGEIEDLAISALQSQAWVNVEELPARVVAMCKKRGWSMHWTHRGAYLHLEASELIEAIRGKRGDPIDESGDVLLVLMSITEYNSIPFSKTIEAAIKKLEWLETSPPYRGEECSLPTPPGETE